MSKADRATLQNPIIAKRTALDAPSERGGFFARRRDSQGDTEIGPVRSSPESLFRIALGIAAKERSEQVRRLTTGEIDALLNVDYGTEPSGPSQTAELEVLVRIIGELPASRRALLTAVLLEKAPRPDLARRFGLSQDALEREVALALEQASAQLRQALGPDSDPTAPESSND